MKKFTYNRLFKVIISLFLSYQSYTLAETESFAVSVSLTMEGFNEHGFDSDSIELTSIWYGQPEFPNYVSYWGELETFCSQQMCMSNISSQPLKFSELPIKKEVDFNQIEYLESSDLIELDHKIIQQAYTSLTLLKAQNLNEKIKNILSKVHELLYYTETNNLFLLRTTSEIFHGYDYGQPAEGECKSFSNVFVALSRLSDIPARVISGFILTKHGPLGHYWVEIFLGSEIGWVPIEPQKLKGDISPYYIPDGVVSEFLEGANSRDHILHVNLLTSITGQ